MNNKTIGARKSKGNKKLPFDNSLRVNQKKPNYDALGDPHASYYFLNKPMRKHLNSLRKSIQREGSFVQKKKIRYMISQRIKDYDSVDRKMKARVYYYNMKSSPSISSMQSFRSRKSLQNQQIDHHKKSIKSNKMDRQVQQKARTLQLQLVKNKDKKHKNQAIDLPKISQKKLDPKNQVKQQSKLDSLNKTEHNKFLKFITQRRNKLPSKNPNVDGLLIK